VFGKKQQEVSDLLLGPCDTLVEMEIERGSNPASEQPKRSSPGTQHDRLAFLLHCHMHAFLIYQDFFHLHVHGGGQTFGFYECEFP
jgi:hypothetical protein